MNNLNTGPKPPDLAQVTWRPITVADLNAVIELVKACFTADGGLHFLFVPEEISTHYFNAGSARGIGAFLSNGQLAACNTLYFGRDAGKQRIMSMGQVHPDFRGQGIGRYLMGWSEAHSKLLAADLPPSQRVIRVKSESHTDAADRLYRAHGFEHVTEELIMSRSLSQPIPKRPIAENITVTNWHQDVADRFFEAYENSFRTRPGFPGMSRADWVENWTVDNDEFKPEWSMLLLDNGVPIGFSLASDDAPAGFIMQVGVIPQWRRRGYCAYLMAESMRRMEKEGMESIMLTVNVNNPDAIKSYQSIGFETTGRRARYDRSVG